VILLFVEFVNLWLGYFEIGIWFHDGVLANLFQIKIHVLALFFVLGLYFTFEAYEIARYHNLGNLPQQEFTHRFF